MCLYRQVSKTMTNLSLPTETTVGSCEILTGLAAVDREAAPLAHKGLAEAGASAQHLAGIGVS